jgi:DNA-binding response OmpR family regulator
VGSSGLGASEFSGPALVIEDDALIALAVADMLEQLGFGPIETARTSDDAMRLIAGNFAIAIVDIRLEGSDTFDVARKLKFNATPFVFASGYSVRLPADLAGVPFAAKPFNEATLAEAIRGAFSSRGLGQ